MNLRFNPHPRVQVLPISQGSPCVLIDDALLDPVGVAGWAAQQPFIQPNYPYPGLVCEAPAELVQGLSELFLLHVRKPLGVRRLHDLKLRFSLATTPPQELAPMQWQCHRDHVAERDSGLLVAACVLYLFRDPALGGTSFYRPRQSALQTDQMMADSLSLDAQDFGARYGLRPGYMDGSNAYFEQVAQFRAAWNRVIFYDGSLFHTADVGPASAALSADPRVGRLTLNAFIAGRPVLGG